MINLKEIREKVMGDPEEVKGINKAVRIMVTESGKIEQIQIATVKAVIEEDKAWSLITVLDKLIEASEILLHEKDYDGHNWEEIGQCVERAKQFKNKLNQILKQIGETK